MASYSNFRQCSFCNLRDSVAAGLTRFFLLLDETGWRQDCDFFESDRDRS